MRVEPSRTIVERVQRARERTPGGLVAFDADGTLWTGDVGDDFLHAMIAADALHPPALDALRVAAEAHGLATEGTGASLLRRVLEAFEAQRFAEDVLYAATAWLCAGRRRAEVTSFTREVIARSQLEGRLQSEAHAVLRWAQREGIDVRIVSASPQHVVEEAMRAVGLDTVRVVAMRPVYRDDVMEADVETPLPYGPGKVAALRAHDGSRPIYAAFGDSAFDLPLLAASEVPVAVRPKAKLVARAGELAALVELGREAPVG